MIEMTDQETEEFLDEMEKENISNTPLGRVATTDDVAMYYFTA